MQPEPNKSPEAPKLSLVPDLPSDPRFTPREDGSNPLLMTDVEQVEAATRQEADPQSQTIPQMWKAELATVRPVAQPTEVLKIGGTDSNVISLTEAAKAATRTSGVSTAESGATTAPEEGDDNDNSSTDGPEDV